MDPILQTLLSWQFILFSLAIATTVFFTRTVVEYIFSVSNYINKESPLWREVILPVLPIIVGVFCAAIIKEFPYPNGLSSVGSRIIFGLVAGSLSGILYRVLNSLLAMKITAVVQDVLPPQINTTTTTTVQNGPTTTVQQVQVSNGDQIPQNQLPPRGQQ